MTETEIRHPGQVVAVPNRGKEPMDAGAEGGARLSLVGDADIGDGIDGFGFTERITMRSGVAHYRKI